MKTQLLQGHRGGVVEAAEPEQSISGAPVRVYEKLACVPVYAQPVVDEEPREYTITGPRGPP
jgi:hypothetical protein